MRLEPGCRNANMSAGLQARIYDPLWLMARQWQMREFQGEDNGSPAIATFKAESSRLTRFHAGSILPNTALKAPEFDGTQFPLETIVEREQVRRSAETMGEHLRLAADAGLHFLRLLEQQPVSHNYREAFTKQFAFKPLSAEFRNTFDDESLGYVDLIAGRGLDGHQLYVALKPDKNGQIAFPAEFHINSGDRSEL